jgi:hypothetical protein
VCMTGANTCCVPNNNGNCLNYCGDLGCGLPECKCPPDKVCGILGGVKMCCEQKTGYCGGSYCDCPTGYICDIDNGVCKKPCELGFCGYNCIGECTSGLECASGVCYPSGCPKGTVNINTVYPSIFSGNYNIVVTGTENYLGIDDSGIVSTSSSPPQKWTYDSVKNTLSMSTAQGVMYVQAFDPFQGNCGSMYTATQESLTNSAINFILSTNEVSGGSGYIYSVQNNGYLIPGTNCTSGVCGVTYTSDVTQAGVWTFGN